MAQTSAAMELKVLISVLQSGNALQNMLNQINQVSKALTLLQQQSTGAGTGLPAGGQGTIQANALANALNSVAGGASNTGKASKQAAPEVLNLEEALGKLWRAVKFLSGGFLALQSIRFLKDLADTAARTEVLGTVLGIVARNAGYTQDEITKVDKSIQRLGITAQSSRQSLTQLLQADLPLKYAADLARASQDLAVISGMDSSTTLQRLIVNIQQLDTFGLRMMGIIVSRTEAEAKFAKTIDKTKDSLSQRERQEALTIAVMEKSKTLAGSYEAAMGNVGKQISSLNRFSLELKSSLGDFLLPAYRAIVRELTLFLAHMTNLGKEFSSNRSAAEQFAYWVGAVAKALRITAETIAEYYKWVLLMIKAWLTWKGIGILVELQKQYQLYGLMGTAMLQLGLATKETAAATTVLSVAFKTLQATGILYLVLVLAAAMQRFAKAMKDAADAYDKGELWKHLSKRETGSGRFREMAEVLSGDLLDFGSDEAREAERVKERDKTTTGLEAIAEQVSPGYLSRQDAIAAKRRETNEAISATILAEADYTDARERGMQKDIDATKKAHNTAKELQKQKEQEFDTLLTTYAVKDPERVRVEKQITDRQKEYVRLKRLTDASNQASESLFGGKLSISEGKVGGADFNKRLNELRTYLDVFDEVQKARARVEAAKKTGAPTETDTEFLQRHADVALELREGLKLAVSTPTQPQDVLDLTKFVEDFKKRLPSESKFAELGLAVARAKVESAQQAFGAEARERQKRILDAQFDAEVEFYRQSLALTQAANEKRNDEDTHAYELGILSLEEFYANKIARNKQQNADELALQDAQIRKARSELLTAAPRDVASIRNRIQAEENQRELTRQEGERRAAQLITERDNARISLARQLFDITNKTAQAYGSQSAAIADINEKYKRLQIDLKAKATEEGIGVDPRITRALQEAQTQELEIAFAKQREAVVQADLQHQASLRSQNDLERAILKTREEQVQADLETRRITEPVALQRQNQIIQERISLAREEQASLRETLALQKEQLRTVPETRRQELEAFRLARPDELSQEEIERQITELTGSLVQGARATQTQMEAVSQSIIQMMDSMDSYGKRLSKSFQEGFASALTQTIIDYRKAGQAWVSLSQSIANEIISVFTKAFTQRLLRKTRTIWDC